MQTRGKKPSVRSAKSAPLTRDEAQLKRFKEMAQEIGADESPGALDRAFSKLGPKNRPDKPAAK